MAVNCTLCGVSMAVAETPGHRGGVVAPYHRDCAQLAYELSMADKDPMPFQHAIIQRKIDKLIHKRTAVVDEFP